MQVLERAKFYEQGKTCRMAQTSGPCTKVEREAAPGSESGEYSCCINNTALSAVTLIFNNDEQLASLGIIGVCS